MTTKSKILLAVYILITIIVFFALWYSWGSFRAWMFAAVACGLPAMLDKSEKSEK